METCIVNAMVQCLGSLELLGWRLARRMGKTSLTVNRWLLKLVLAE